VAYSSVKGCEYGDNCKFKHEYPTTDSDRAYIKKFIGRKGLTVKAGLNLE
jgi:hypothetical protein